MSATVLYMSMSLDGFIAGPNEGPGNGLGDGGEVLHEWVFANADDAEGHSGHKEAARRAIGVNRRIIDEFMATGAVVAGRGTFEPAGGWDGDHHDGVPVYILSRQPKPDWAAGWDNVHYMDDLAAIMREAREAAGDKNVMVHGAGITGRALALGLLDEIEISLVPVLLGDGRPLFGEVEDAPWRLERTRVLEGEGGVTHLHYRVHSAG